MGMATTHEMPQGAEFLSIQDQDGIACAWFMVLPDQPKTTRKFKCYGTGWPIPMNEKYLGTFQRVPFVWHLFEELDSNGK